MRYIFIAKSWHIFILLLLGFVFKSLSIDDNDLQDALLSLAGVLIFFAWHLSISFGMRKYLPLNANINYNLYIINTMAWIVIYSISIMVIDWQDITFEGMRTLPLIYLTYAFLHFMIVPAKVINIMEKGRPVKFSEYVGDFFLILLLPIGIWVLQPRINKIALRKRETKAT